MQTTKAASDGIFAMEIDKEAHLKVTVYCLEQAHERLKEMSDAGLLDSDTWRAKNDVENALALIQRKGIRVKW